MKPSNKLSTQRVRLDRGPDGVKVERAGDGASTLMPAGPRSTLAPKFVSFTSTFLLALQDCISVVNCASPFRNTYVNFIAFLDPISDRIVPQFFVLYRELENFCKSIFAHRASLKEPPSRETARPIVGAYILPIFHAEHRPQSAKVTNKLQIVTDNGRPKTYVIILPLESY